MANQRIEADVCVIGAGSAGLSVAAGASQMGASTVLVERGRMGGDCLNFGCVPSKALLAAGKAAVAAGSGLPFGISAPPPGVDFGRAMRHVHEVIGAIAPHDSAARFEALGVRVLKTAARFTAADRLQAGGTEVQARRFVIATGSRPAVPPIPGLDRVPFLTNETVFENTELPRHLVVIGGGPIGLEMAQAHRRLGSEVTVVEAGRVLGKDDPELVEIVLQRLAAEGVTVHAGVSVAGVATVAGGIEVRLETPRGPESLAASHLLVAAGRRPNVEDLDLDKAGVDFDGKGIRVDGRLRTSNRRIYAAGDVAGQMQFTHVAGYHAGIVLRNMLFRLPARTDHGNIPWVTYTDPELAYVGLSEQAARERSGSVRILRSAYAENDRARTERQTQGFVKVLTSRRGRILGAGIVGAHAGELILPWVLALSKGLKIGAMANVVAPYPTLGEIGKRAAGAYYAPMLFSGRTRAVVRFLMRLG